MEKNIQKIKIKNQLELWAFCAVIGTVAGALVWALLKIMASGTEMIWEWIPERIHIPYYTVLVCTVGGAIIGIFRKLYGDYPEDMETVMGKVKKEKRYEYKNMLVMMIAALLPLLIGSSVGPEAGLTGIIVGLCYWAGENLKFAKQHTKEYSQIGAAVSLSVLFHAPLFGIFEVEEDPDMQMAELGKGSKIFIYGIALAAGTGSYAGLSALLGGGMSGFPSFDAVAVQRIDYVMMLVYMFCGCVLAYFYETTHTVTEIIAGKIPGRSICKARTCPVRRESRRTATSAGRRPCFGRTKSRRLRAGPPSGSNRNREIRRSKRSPARPPAMRRPYASASGDRRSQGSHRSGPCRTRRSPPPSMQCY